MPYVHPDSADMLYLNRDKTKVVAEDSPEAAYVLVGPGGTLSDEEAAKYGLGQKRGAGPTENKMAAPATEDKAPIDGYDDMTVAEVLEALRGDVDRDAIRRYESAHKARKSILEAL